MYAVTETSFAAHANDIGIKRDPATSADLTFWASGTQKGKNHTRLSRNESIRSQNIGVLNLLGQQKMIRAPRRSPILDPDTMISESSEWARTLFAIIGTMQVSKYR